MSADDVARAVERLALGIMHSLQAQALVVPPLAYESHKVRACVRPRLRFVPPRETVK